MDDDEVMRGLECGNSDLIWDYRMGGLISERCARAQPGSPVARGYSSA